MLMTAALKRGFPFLRSELILRVPVCMFLPSLFSFLRKQKREEALLDEESGMFLNHGLVGFSLKGKKIKIKTLLMDIQEHYSTITVKQLSAVSSRVSNKHTK